MDKKILALLAAVVVVVVVGAAAFVVLGDDDDGKYSDYTILESKENIKEGLTIRISSENKYDDSDVTVKVGSVADGKVTYEYALKHSSAQDIDFDTAVSLAVNFDFTDSSEIPEGVTVTESDNVYTIKGKAVDDYQDDEGSYTSEDIYDLEITLNGDNATKVVGKRISSTSETEKGVEVNSESFEYNFTSSDVTVCFKSTGSFKEIKTAAVGDFFGKILNSFSKEQGAGGVFENADVSLISDSKSYGNVKAAYYSVKGDCGLLGTDADLTVIVYKDFILGIEGKDTKYKVEMY